MKKLVILVLLAFSFASYAQERTVENSFGRNPITSLNYSYFEVNGGSSDKLISTTRDTIDYVFDTKKSKLFDISAMVTLDTIAGADTTATFAILGRNSENDSWNAIASTTTSAVATDDVFTELTTYASYYEQHVIDTTLTSGAIAIDTVSYYVTNVDYSAVSYRWINLRLIIDGDDATGTGISVDKVELKLWEK